MYASGDDGGSCQIVRLVRCPTRLRSISTPKRRAAATSAQNASRRMASAEVVGGRVGVAHHHVVGLDLRERLPPGRVGHPLQLAEVVLQDRQQVVRDLLDLRLRGGWKVPVRVRAAERLSEQRLGRFEAAHRAGPDRSRAAEVLVPEREGLVGKGLREPRRRRLQHLQGEVGLPHRHGRRFELAVQALEERGLGHVDVDPREPGLREIAVPVHARSDLLELREGHLVRGPGRVGGRRGRQARLGEAGLECENFVGGLSRIRHSAERQDGRDVRSVLFALLREGRIGLQVVVPVGQPQAAGGNVCDDGGGVAVVRGAGERERRRNRQLVELSDHALDAGDIPDVCDVGEQRGQRRHARGLDRGLVHARGVVVAELALGWIGPSGGPVRLRGQLLQEGLQLLPVRLARGPAPAPALRSGRNGVRGAPGAVGESVEVRARLRGAVQVAELDAFRRPALRGERGGVRSRGDRGDTRDGEGRAGDQSETQDFHDALLEETGVCKAAITVPVLTTVANSP